MNPEVFENCSTILIDIAGTVGSINFTKDTLFAFAKKNIDEYLTAKWEDEEVKKLVAELKGDGEDLADVTKAVERFNALTDENSVNTGVKALQGLLYKQGYEKGDLKAHVFDDIKNALEEWSKHRKICVYSTGAEEAQKQYFTHSTAGDLTAFIANYFDQTVGKKTASESYESIAKTLDVKPQDIVFLSDDIEEIKAAATAGCTPVLVTRDGNAEVSEEDKKDRLVVSSFADLPLSSKRKSEEEVSTEEPPTKVAKLDTDAKPEEAKTEEPKVEEAKEATETMEVDSSESTPAADTTDKAAPETETAVEATETPKESAEATPAVESTTETAVADTTKTDKAEEKTEEPASTTDAPVEKMDDTPAPASTTTDKPEEKTEEVDAAKTEVVEKEAEAAVPAKPAESETETKADAADEKPAEPETTEEKPAEVKQNGKENGEKVEETKAEENGASKTNGDAAEEKENNSDIANGTAEVTETDKKVEEEVKASAEEVKVKKIDDATETAAPLTVEA